MKVREIMTEEVQAGSVPGAVQTVYEIFRDKKVSGIPIVKKQTGELVGVLTRSDLIKNPDEDQIALQHLLMKM